MGTPEFAVPSLEILIRHYYPIQAVVTAPDKPRGRGQQLSHTPLKVFALKHNLDVLQPESLKDPSFVDRLKKLRPELMVVVAFRILPKEVFTIPSLGAFNLHASLLPKYRGAAPIHWAIINGEIETGVTTFLLKEKVDTGNVVLQGRIPIRPDDHAGTVHDRLAEVGAEIVLHTVRLIEQGKANPRAQDDTLATPAPKILKKDCEIFWNQPALSIHNRIRGLSPYPTAFTVHRGKMLKIYRSQLVDAPAHGSPGDVEVSRTSLHVATADKMLALVELQQEGRKKMHAEEFLRGYRFVEGDRLGAGTGKEEE